LTAAADNEIVLRFIRQAGGNSEMKFRILSDSVELYTNAPGAVSRWTSYSLQNADDMARFQSLIRQGSVGAVRGSAAPTYTAVEIATKGAKAEQRVLYKSVEHFDDLLVSGVKHAKNGGKFFSLMSRAAPIASKVAGKALGILGITLVAVDLANPNEPRLYGIELIPTETVHKSCDQIG
jgi:hypothetical protein